MFAFIRRLFSFSPFKPFIKNWNITPHKELWFAGKPTQKQEVVAAKLTPLAIIEAELGIKWTENILVETNKFKRLSAFFKQIPNNFYPISETEYLECINQFSENCVIRWLDNELRWVVTLRAGKTLKKGLVSAYTGIMKIIPISQDATYELREYFNTVLKTEQYEIVVDAKEYGNHSRLLPFMLEAKYLENFQIDPSIKDKIAVANLEFHLANLNGIILPCVFAPEDIIAPPDRELLLGLNYSLAYLCKMQQTHKTFKFLDSQSFQQLDPKLYPLKQIEIKLEGMDYSFNLSRLRIMVAEQLPQLKHTTLGFDDVSQQYYEITVYDIDLYKALMASPDQACITVKPKIGPLS